MDWSLCIICQTDSDEIPLSCPQKRQSKDAYDVYKDFLENVRQFKSLDALPVCVEFGEEGTPECFMENHASWHRACHQKFNRSKLERAITKKRKLSLSDEADASSSFRHSKRQTSKISNLLCIFCEDGGSGLHEYATFKAGQSLQAMATEMQDTKLLSKVLCGDLVANEAKYHLSCLTKYRNKYRSFKSQNDPAALSRRCTTAKVQMAKARAFVELVAYMENSVEEGTFLFKLTQIHNMYEKRLNDFDLDISFNKTRLKEQLLTHFRDSGLQEQSDGKCTILAFPEGIQHLLRDAFLHHDYDEEAKLFAKVAKICRDEIFKEEIRFSGSFEPGCQQDIVPTTRLLLSMILYGPNLSLSVEDTQACLTLAQLLIHNAKKKMDLNASHQRHSLDREPPIPLYIGMSLHTQTRSKQLVDQMAKLGISITYDRIVQVENSLAMSMCEQYKKDNIVCPSQLRKSVFTIGALDNVDHNPSSTTSQGSFHGTSISIIQQPTVVVPGILRDKPNFEHSKKSTGKPHLPDKYTVVPAVYMKPSVLAVPENDRALTIQNEDDANVNQAIDEEELWINEATPLLSENITKDNAVSWAAYHASRQDMPSNPPAITALLPLFNEKADSPAMVKHAMTIVKDTTEFLNAGQMPVIACDCPIFAMCKYTQWKYPETHGEEKIVIMFGGLHIEKALWTALGDMLDCSGWTDALAESGVTTAGTAQSFLNAAHITRTRHAHQVTVLALAKLQRDAFQQSRVDGNEANFDTWRLQMIEKSPTFQFWDMIRRYESLILIFVRAHREKNFVLYVEVLELLMFLFFALDHQNYSRWLSIHLRDMKSLPQNFLDDFKEHWVVMKNNNRFSAIPIDQTHEQENAKVKGKGGVIGLTENPDAFKRWMISGPEQARLLTSFEQEYLPMDNEDINYKHHEEGLSTQISFQEQVNSLIEKVVEFGNPFLDDCQELLVLHTRECNDERAANNVRNLERLGYSQYKAFQKDVVAERTKSIHDAIKRNNLTLFKTPKVKKNKASKQLASARNDANLFGRLYIANQQRGGDLDVFFAHENQTSPPSLADGCELRTGTKSDLLKCISADDDRQMPDRFDCKVFDGGALIHTLPTNAVSTFREYAERVFLPMIERELQHSTDRVDIVWDRYLPNSIKASTRVKRGCGIRLKVGPQTMLPSKWKDFLLDSSNKSELFAYLTETVQHHQWPENKSVFITNDDKVVSKTTGQHMPNCTQEEADTRIIVHTFHALAEGAKSIQIRTVDTDVLVILLSKFYDLQQICPEIELCVAFGVGKDYRLYSVNALYASVGRRTSQAMPMFHAFTGCDTTSTFFRKGKKTAWLAWKSYPMVTSAFLEVYNNPFQEITIDSEMFKQLERFTVILYDKNCSEQNVNAARRELFSKKSKSLENIPPTKDALLQHIKRASLQAGIWCTSHQCQPPVPDAEGWGWTMGVNAWTPVWITQPEAAKACTELIKCGCKSVRGCRTCKCAKLGLTCTDLCSCTCEK